MVRSFCQFDEKEGSYGKVPRECILIEESSAQWLALTHPFLLFPGSAAEWVRNGSFCLPSQAKASRYRETVQENIEPQGLLPKIKAK